MSIRTAISVAACLSALAGCTLAPGSYLDKSRMQDDLSAKTSTQVYPVTPITPQVIEAQVEAQRSAPPFGPVSGIDANADYRVGVGDIIGVTVWNHPELAAANATTAAATAVGASGAQGAGGLEIDPAGQRVGNDGTIFFPTLGRVQAAGQTTAAIGAALMQGLSRSIVHPKLEVHVLQYRSQQVQITGDLKTPGTLPITDTPLRVVDAIARSGGAQADADLQRVQLTRDGKTTVLNIHAALEHGQVNQNVLLQNGDIVNVPDNSQSRVFVLGEVMKPQPVLMNQGRLTLADAISKVNSIDSGSADPRQIYVIRRSLADPTKPSLYRLDMTQIDAMLLTTEFQLQPLDIVYVGTASLTRFNRMLSQLLPTAESLYLLNTVRP
jgi:polysaccharide export outer membrane protein